jgi:TolA-binding protein
MAAANHVHVVSHLVTQLVKRVENLERVDEGQKKDDANVLVSVTRVEEQLKGVAGELSRLSGSLLEMSKEQARKHEDNIARIESNHKENTNILSIQSAALIAHKEEDAKNFQKVDQLLDRFWFGFKVLSIVWTGLCVCGAAGWALFVWVSK